jgi:hypothetical protein
MILKVSDGFPYYISLVGSSNVNEGFHADAIFKLVSPLTEEQMSYRYAPGKWSIKQIIGHMADHERIMMYRALRFSRKDPTPLPGYDQDILVAGSRFDEILGKDLVADFKNVRKATLSFISSLSAEQLQLKGVASKFEITVGDVVKGTLGHELHHIKILQEKYFPVK